MRRGDGLWVLAVGLLLMAGSGLFPQMSRPDRYGSFSRESSGKHAFFALIELLLPQVRRNTEHLVPPEDADTLVILGPARYPDRVEWNRLHAWVSSGKSLVFVARWRSPAMEMGPFGVRIVEEGPSTNASFETDLTRGDLDWQSSAHVQVGSAEAETFASSNGRPQVVRIKVGAGLLVVVSSDYVFNNRTLSRGDNAVLAFRILELARPRGTVYFDEWINEAGTPKIVGLLFDEPFRGLTFQLLLCAVVFAWRTSRHFGQKRSPETAPRRSLREHAEALGNLHFKIGTGARLFAAYFDYFRRDLHLSKERDAARLLAQKAGVEPESTARIFGRALRATRNPHLPAASAAELIRGLAALRQKTLGAKGGLHGA